MKWRRRRRRLSNPVLGSRRATRQLLLLSLRGFVVLLLVLLLLLHLLLRHLLLLKLLLLLSLLLLHLLLLELLLLQVLLLLQGADLLLGRRGAACLPLLLGFLCFGLLVRVGDLLQENPVLLLKDPLLRQVLELQLTLLQLLL